MRCKNCRTERNYLLPKLRFNNKSKTLCIECATTELFEQYKDKKEIIIIEKDKKETSIGIIKWLNKKL